MDETYLNAIPKDVLNLAKKYNEPKIIVSKNNLHPHGARYEISLVTNEFDTSIDIFEDIDKARLTEFVNSFDNGYARLDVYNNHRNIITFNDGIITIITGIVRVQLNKDFTARFLNALKDVIKEL